MDTCSSAVSVRKTWISCSSVVSVRKTWIHVAVL